MGPLITDWAPRKFGRLLGEQCRGGFGGIRSIAVGSYVLGPLLGVRELARILEWIHGVQKCY